MTPNSPLCSPLPPAALPRTADCESGHCRPEPGGRLVARVRLEGHQPGFGGRPGRDLYTVLEADGLSAGTTLSDRTLEEMGYQVQVVS